MQKNNIILFTDDLGLEVLLHSLPESSIAAVVIAANRPHVYQAVSSILESHTLPIMIQPYYESPDYSDFCEQLRQLNPTAIVCYSYSMLIRESILALVNYSAINFHASLLPKNRGPNPIQWALIKGEAETGFTAHYMDSEFDSGDIIQQARVLIDETDTWVSLSKKLSVIGSGLCKKVCANLLSGIVHSQKQNNEVATHNSRLSSDSPLVQFDKMTDRAVFNLIRAQVKPLSGAFCYYQGNKIVFDKYIAADKVAEIRRKYA